MGKRFSKGDKAPDFKVVSVHGDPVRLHGSKSNYTLVVFLRYAGCPWCNLAVHRLTLESKLLKQSNCDTIAFIQSTPENIEKNIYKRHNHKPTFPIIADQAMETYKLYGVQVGGAAGIKQYTKLPSWVHAVGKLGFRQGKVDGNLFLVPAYFLISGKTKQIVDVSYAADFYDHGTFTSIYESLNFAE
jgi:peroxiredoxin Q/BCP